MRCYKLYDYREVCSETHWRRHRSASIHFSPARQERWSRMPTTQLGRKTLSRFLLRQGRDEDQWGTEWKWKINWQQMLDVASDPLLELWKKKKQTPNVIQALCFSAPHLPQTHTFQTAPLSVSGLVAIFLYLTLNTHLSARTRPNTLHWSPVLVWWRLARSENTEQETVRETRGDKSDILMLHTNYKCHIVSWDL